MPKAVKLHSKNKANSILKSNKLEDNNATDKDPEDATREFQLQLCWCIQQLERTLNEKKANEKQLQEAWKVLTVLKNNNQPIIRKRQLMRTHFGDYRAKMAVEEKKLAKMASKIKISESPIQPKATFLRKSAYLTTGDETFRFNFNIPPENIDNGNTDAVTDSSVDKNSSSNIKDNQLSAGVTSLEKLDDKKTRQDKVRKRITSSLLIPHLVLSLISK